MSPPLSEATAHAGLRARGLSVTFPGQNTPALDDVDLDVAAGRVLALLGPSGCGKSTALRVVAGLQDATGCVMYDGVDITRSPAHRRGFSLMFQDGQLFGHLDVFDNVAYGLRRRKASKTEVESRVGELLDLVGLAGFGNRQPFTLSGGQQQRVALARALAPKPRLLLLDEPLSALDRTLRERLAGDLRQVVTAEGVTALFVTHDHEEALTVADDVALMRAGRIVQSGAVRAVWQAPVDAEAAVFMGYTTVFDAVDAHRVGLPAGAWALRRTAWQLAAADENALAGVVRHVGASGDFMNVSIELDALPGRCVEAALPTKISGALPTEGARLSLELDASRCVRLP